jgi:uncharacterized phage infection (PIP) family protein YhgE
MHFVQNSKFLSIFLILAVLVFSNFIISQLTFAEEFFFGQFLSADSEIDTSPEEKEKSYSEQSEISENSDKNQSEKNLEKNLRENAEKSPEDSGKTEEKTEEKEEEDPDEFMKFLSDGGREAIQSVPSKNIENIADKISKIYKILKEIDLQSKQLSALADAAILSAAYKENFFPNNTREFAEEVINHATEILNTQNREKYNLKDDYEIMKIKSEKFASLGKKTGSCMPENVIFLSEFLLNDYPIAYEKEILISVEDFSRKINAKVNYMENNSTIVIEIDKKLIEIESGSKEIFINDKKEIMPVAVLNVDGKNYIPCSAMEAADKTVFGIPSVPVVIII